MAKKKCDCETKLTTEMDYHEFTRWAHEYAVNGFLTGGLKGLRISIEMIVQQQNMNHAKNGGGFPK